MKTSLRSFLMIRDHQCFWAVDVCFRARLCPQPKPRAQLRLGWWVQLWYLMAEMFLVLCLSRASALSSSSFSSSWITFTRSPSPLSSAIAFTVINRKQWWNWETLVRRLLQTSTLPYPSATGFSSWHNLVVLSWICPSLSRSRADDTKKLLLSF